MSELPGSYVPSWMLCSIHPGKVAVTMSNGTHRWSFSALQPTPYITPTVELLFIKREQMKGISSRTADSLMGPHAISVNISGCEDPGIGACRHYHATLLKAATGRNLRPI